VIARSLVRVMVAAATIGEEATMRRTIAAVFLLLAVALTQSCSSSVEDVSSGAQPLIGSCGASRRP